MATPKNPVAPFTTLTIAGVDYQLLFDFTAVAHAEDLTDQPLLTGLNHKSINTPKISFVQAMLYAALLPLQPKITFAEAKALVNRKNWMMIWAQVMESWIAGLAEPEPVDEDEDADPKLAQS